LTYSESVSHGSDARVRGQQGLEREQVVPLDNEIAIQRRLFPLPNSNFASNSSRQCGTVWWYVSMALLPLNCSTGMVERSF
jgi:hypothetical protein